MIRIFIVALFVATAGMFQPAKATGSACWINLTHDLRVAEKIHSSIDQLNAQLVAVTGVHQTELIRAGVEVMRQSLTNNFMSQILRSSRRSNPLELAIYQALDRRETGRPLFRELGRQAANENERSLLASELILHLIFGYLISEDLRQAQGGISIPETRITMTKGQRLFYQAARDVLAASRACTQQPQSCHPYIERLAQIFTLVTSRPDMGTDVFPRAREAVEGAYLDIASGVLFGTLDSMPRFERNRRYLLIDNSPFVTSGLNALAEHFDKPNVEAVTLDASSTLAFERIRQPLAVLRVKNAGVYVPDFQAVLEGLVTWIVPGGQVIFLLDDRVPERTAWRVDFPFDHRGVGAQRGAS